ncbi:MAG: hypothetical protein KBA75_04445 [Alphaproteobacteria bacterium]|nr:hypothetical protein [Alphaproteobacteria bacterium]
MPRVDNKTGNGFSEYAYSIVGVTADGRRVSRTVPDVGAPQLLEMMRDISTANAEEAKKPQAKRIHYTLSEYDARESARAAYEAIIKAMRRPPLLGAPYPKG